jgi:hypothetical protein
MKIWGSLIVYPSSLATIISPFGSIILGLQVSDLDFAHSSILSQSAHFLSGFILETMFLVAFG